MKPQLQLIASPHRQAPIQKPVLLEIEGLSKRFETNGAGAVRVLERIDFSVRQGELICMLGRSGCGKTTLLNILAGFTPASGGSVRLKGRPVSAPGPDRCVVFQQDALFPWLTVRENIAFGLKGRPMGRGEKRREIERFLSLVGLADFGDYLPREISGGMQQRVSLARVLILQPQVLLMDEPFAALDAQTREEMQSLLLELWQRFAHTILFVTHDVAEAVLLADRVLLFDQAPGRIRQEIPIALPRPRDPATDGYLAHCQAITAKIKGL